MVFCAVMGCSNNNNKKSKSYKPNCRYFSFPKEKHVCDSWVQMCFQQHNFNVKTARICSYHFVDSDYCCKEKLLELPHNKWKLRPNSIPSVNLPNIRKPSIQPDLPSKLGYHVKLERSENEDDRTSREDECIYPEKCITIDLQLQGYEVKLERSGNEDYRVLREDEFVYPEERIIVATQPERYHLKSERGETKDATAPREDKFIYPEKNSTIGTQTESSGDVHLDRLKQLEYECAHLRSVVEQQARQLQALERIFSTGQLWQLPSGRQAKWAMEDITESISGPRCSQILSKRGYPLLGASTLRRSGNGTIKSIIGPLSFHIIRKYVQTLSDHRIKTR